MEAVQMARLPSIQVCVANLLYTCTRCNKLLARTLKSQGYKLLAIARLRSFAFGFLGR